MQQKRTLILICGASGVGKTSVCNGLLKDGINVVNIGTMMKDLSKSFNLKVEDRDKIKEGNPKINSKIREEAARRIVQMSGDIIIDTHVNVALNGRVIAGIPLNFVNIIKNELDAIIYIDATNEELYNRRMLDKSRNREIETHEEIERYRNLNMGVLAYYMVYLDIPIYIINNKEGELKDTIKRCEEILEEVRRW